jgi:hypothetical protein
MKWSGGFNSTGQLEGPKFLGDAVVRDSGLGSFAEQSSTNLQYLMADNGIVNAFTAHIVFETDGPGVMGGNVLHVELFINGASVATAVLQEANRSDFALGPFPAAFLQTMDVKVTLAESGDTGLFNFIVTAMASWR